MKIFISWSGQKSESFAIEFRSWLMSMFQSLDIWISKKDISVGARWYILLAKALEESSVGIICLTKENLTSPWILFESGALSKAVDSALLIPVLIDIEKSELSGPLSFFQAVSLEKNEFWSFILMINQTAKNNFRDLKILEAVFEKWWPDFKEKADQIASSVGRIRTSDFRILTTRELTIITLLKEGKTLKQISEQIKISLHTMMTYISRIKTKLSAESTEEIIELAKYYDLIE